MTQIKMWKEVAGLTEAEARAREVIAGHRKPFDKLVAALEKEETLLRDAIEACLEPDRAISPQSAEPATTG